MENIKKASLYLTVILLFTQSTAMAAGNYTLPQSTIAYLKHNRKEAERIFKKDCTKCHSAKTALSRRAYQDWLLGITYRHGKSKGWIPEKDAKKIFFHLIVHLEPEFKQLTGSKKHYSDKELVNPTTHHNWHIHLFTTLSYSSFCPQ